MDVIRPLSESQPAAVQVVFGLVAVALTFGFIFSFLTGTALLGLLVWLEFGRASCNRGWSQPLILPVLCLFCQVLQVVPYLFIPTGAHLGHMMDLAFLTSTVTLTGVAIAGGIVYGTKHHANYVFLAMALVLSLMILPTGVFAVRGVVHIKGFVFE